MAGVQKIDVDFSRKMAVVRFDPKKARISAIVKKIDDTRFGASLKAAVAQVLENPQVRVRVQPDALKYEAGAEGKIQIVITPKEGVKLGDLTIGKKTSWSDASEKDKEAEALSEKHEFSLPFVAPKKDGKVSILVSYLPQKDGEKGEKTSHSLEVAIAVEA